MSRRRRPAPPADNQSPRETSQIGPRQLKDPASPQFAWQTLALLKTFYESQRVSVARFEKVLGEAREYRIYEKIPEEQPYGSLDEMLRAELGVEGAASLGAPGALRRAWLRATEAERAAFRREIDAQGKEST